jgi:putative ferrous iron transport protein C
MNLLEIKNYLMRVRIASLSSLCTYFNCESELLRNMLGHWVRKGCVRKCAKTANCGTKCVQCSPLVTEIYEWVA